MKLSTVDALMIFTLPGTLNSLTLLTLINTTRSPDSSCPYPLNSVEISCLINHQHSSLELISSSTVISAVPHPIRDPD